MSLGLLVFVLGNRKISVRCCTFSSGLLLMYFLVSYLHFQALHFPLENCCSFLGTWQLVKVCISPYPFYLRSPFTFLTLPLKKGEGAWQIKREIYANSLFC